MGRWRGWEAQTDKGRSRFGTMKSMVELKRGVFSLRSK